MKKPRKVKWTKRARRELFGISDYIAHDNPGAADAFAEYVEKIVSDLAVSPIGRPSALDGTTERVLSRYPSYLVIFKYDDYFLNILRIFHTAQQSKI